MELDGVVTLSYLALWGCISAARCLFKYLPDTEIQALDNQCFRFAAYGGHVEMMRFLLSCGADPSSLDNHALKRASANGHLQAVVFLLDECCDKVDVHAEDDMALRFAATNGHLAIVQVLIDHGANAHVLDEFALISAASNNKIDLVRYLVEKCGSDVTISHWRPVRSAIGFGASETAAYLLSYVQRREDFTAIQAEAIRSGHAGLTTLITQQYQQQYLNAA